VDVEIPMCCRGEEREAAVAEAVKVQQEAVVPEKTFMDKMMQWIVGYSARKG
jgi:hypothetical protein